MKKLLVAVFFGTALLGGWRIIAHAQLQGAFQPVIVTTATIPAQPVVNVQNSTQDLDYNPGDSITIISVQNGTTTQATLTVPPGMVAHLHFDLNAKFIGQ